MSSRVIRSVDEFAAGLVRFSADHSQAQREAMRESDRRARRAFRQAATKLAGADQTLSGVGKNGARLDIRIEPRKNDPYHLIREIRSDGPWQLRDDSVRPGPTEMRDITPNLRRTPRPTPAAKKFMPSLKFRSTGEYRSNFNTSGAGPFVVVRNRAPRLPAWRGAVRSLQPRIIEVHKSAFIRTLMKNYS